MTNPGPHVKRVERVESRKGPKMIEENHHYGESLNEEIAGFLNRYTNNLEDLRTVDKRRQAGIDGATENTAEGLYKLRSELIEQKFELCQQRVELMRERADLTKRITEAIRETAVELESKWHNSKEKAAKKLTTAGAGIESQPAWPNNQGAARNTFNIVVERTPTVQKIARDRNEVNELHRRTADEWRVATEELQTAEESLRELASCILK